MTMVTTVKDAFRGNGRRRFCRGALIPFRIRCIQKGEVKVDFHFAFGCLMASWLLLFCGRRLARRASDQPAISAKAPACLLFGMA